MARHRRPLLYLAAIAVLFLAGDRVGAWILDRAVGASHLRFARLYRGGLDNEILVVGDSRAMYSVDAGALSARLCRSVLNLAYLGMPSEIAKAMVEDYLDRNQPPKAVVIEISDAADGAGLVKEMRLFGRSPSHLHDLVRRLDPWYGVWSALLHLYAFNTELTWRSLQRLWRGDPDPVIPDKPLPPAAAAAIRPERYVHWQIRPEGRAALRQLVAELAARHIEPVLYLAPAHPIYLGLVPRYAAWAGELQRELGPRFPILDLSRRLADDRDFSDIMHTNRSGSRFVTAALAQRLRRLLPEASCLRRTGRRRLDRSG